MFIYLSFRDAYHVNWLGKNPHPTLTNEVKRSMIFAYIDGQFQDLLYVYVYATATSMVNCELVNWRDFIMKWCNGNDYALLAICDGNPPVTWGFPSQNASNAEIWWFFDASPLISLVFRLTHKCASGVCHYMMTSSNGNIFRITGPLREEFTGHRCVPRTKASDAELSCFLWFMLE